ncbi:MAG: hypothetical protein ABI670_01885 [Chloroflexota bacterium]
MANAGGKKLDDNVQSSPVVQARDDNLLEWENENVVVFSGYLGRPSAPGGKWRLYRTLTLDEYILFNKDDVLHIANERSSGQEAELIQEVQPVYIWLKSSTPVERILPQFLAGEIASLYMPQADIMRNLNALTANGFTLPTEGGGGTNIAICVH